MFGQEQLECCINGTSSPHRLFQEIQEALTTFTDGHPYHDDIAIVELTGDLLTSIPNRTIPVPGGAPNRTPRWRMTLDFGADFLRHVDPMPELMNMISGVNTLTEQKETIFLIIRELLSNSIEHGLLGLSSMLKDTPEGCSRYYTLREDRLAELQEGNITIHLEHLPQQSGGRCSR